jgi:hypothetical protein
MTSRQFSNDATFAWNKNNGYIDNLIRLFEGSPTVSKAYFGLNPTPKGERELFLAVEQDDESDDIQRMVEMVTQTYAPQKRVFFTSKCYLPEWLDYILPSNFPFYVKDHPQHLHVAIMKHWFEPELYQQDLLSHIRNGRPVSLFKDFDPEDNHIIFQTYVRNGEEFIPLFSSKDMIFKSGMTSVPEDLTVMEFDWLKVDELVQGKLKDQYFVLNPGTSFEVEFMG